MRKLRLHDLVEGDLESWTRLSVAWKMVLAAAPLKTILPMPGLLISR